MARVTTKFLANRDEEVLLPVAQEDRHSHPWSLALFLLSQSQRWPVRKRTCIMHVICSIHLLLLVREAVIYVLAEFVR